MGYSIDTIATESYGLYISTSDGLLNLPEGKEQSFVAYGFQGYQITKRQENELSIVGFIIADDLTDFKAKMAALFTVFSAPGLRSIEDNNANTVTCFSKDGFKIDKVFIPGAVYARFTIIMTIV